MDERPDWASFRRGLRLYVGLKLNKVPGLRWAARRIIWGISGWKEKVRQDRIMDEILDKAFAMSADHKDHYRTP